MVMEKEMDVNETILREVAQLYRGIRDENAGVLAKTFGQQCVPPRRRIHIMVVGNHSAGKSSLINWYMGTDCLKTGVAVETPGFSIVTHGKRRETLTGPATMEAFDYLSPLSVRKGFVENLKTEIVTSSEREKQLITFIDTPGLVDGDTNYPFAVEEIIGDLAKKVDLIIFLIDPIGQALCSRSMKVLEDLNSQHRERLRMYLSKSDSVESSEDLQKVIFQIAQSLPTKNHAATLPTIFLPEAGIEEKKPYLTNKMEDVSRQIDNAIESSVQDALAQVQEDTNKVLESLDNTEKSNAGNTIHNRRMLVRHSVLLVVGVLSMLYPAVLAFAKVIEALPEAALENLRLETLITDNVESYVYWFSYKLASSASGLLDVHNEKPFLVWVCLMVLAASALLVRFVTRRKSVLSNQEQEKLGRYRKQILAVKNRRSELYSLYINQSMDLDETRTAPKPQSAS